MSGAPYMTPGASRRSMVGVGVTTLPPLFSPDPLSAGLAQTWPAELQNLGPKWGAA